MTIAHRHAGEVADVLAGVRGEQKKVGALAGLNGSGVRIVQRGGAIAGGGDDHIERRDAGCHQLFGLAQRVGAVAGERDRHARLEEAQRVPHGDFAACVRQRQRGCERNPQVAQFGEEIGIERFRVADHADERGGAVIQHPLGVGQRGDAADGGRSGLARLGEGGFVAALDVGCHR